MMSPGFDEHPTMSPIRSPASQRVSLGAWYLVAVVVLMVLLSYVDRAVLSLFGTSVQGAYNLSDSQMGLLYGLGFIGPLALVTIFIGWAIDRYNRIMIMLIGLLLWSAMTAACGLVGSYGWLLLARGGVGAGEATLGPAAYALIGDRFPPAQRGRAIGIVAASVSVGTGAALLVGGALLHALGPADRMVPVFGVLANWQLSFLLLGLLGIPIAALLLTLRDPRQHRSATESERPSADWSFLNGRRKLFATILGTGALNVAVGTGIVAWSPTLLLRRFALEPSEAGYLLGCISIVGGLVGAPLAAELSDRWIARGAIGGRLRGHPYFFSVLLCGVAVLALSPNPFIASSGLLMVAMALGAINAVSYASVSDLTPSLMRGKMLATLQFITLACGYGVGPSLVAYLSDHVFHSRDMIGAAFLAASIPLCLIAIAASIAVRHMYLPAQRAIAS